MNYDFDTFVPRRGTDCMKWDSSADGVLPLWVADMDFRAAPAIVDALRAYLHDNYLALLAFVCDLMPALQVARLEATYLAWVDATHLGVPSTELACRLENEAKVKFSPGAIYGEEKGASVLRVNLACPRATLLEALERTAGFLVNLRK